MRGDACEHIAQGSQDGASVLGGSCVSCGKHERGLARLQQRDNLELSSSDMTILRQDNPTSFANFGNPGRVVDI